MSGVRLRSAADILVRGRVQGVGYRAFVLRKAGVLGLVGYAMNLKDGRVRVRVEGMRDAIDGLLRDLEKGPPLSHVEQVEVSWLPPSGRFASFGIRYAEFDS
jgi:acylphosphatase